ncbi:hypothetical protein F5Y07DRAFT_350394 [Xylaria sp. FL0933]|nr:hypothetical protein F5Y07DRAFT_350394 [Xylaria sp. FL0933]
MYANKIDRSLLIRRSGIVSAPWPSIHSSTRPSSLGLMRMCVCLRCFGSGAIAETRSHDQVFCFVCGARVNRECFCCCCCCRRSECTLAPKHGLSHSHVSIVSTCRQRRRQPRTEAPSNMALNLRSSNCTLEECLEITASFPLLSGPTRHPPEGFVMDHSLLCSAAQAMAPCLPWSPIVVMSSPAFAIKMVALPADCFSFSSSPSSQHHSPWLSSHSHSFKASRQLHSFSNSNTAHLAATLAYLPTITAIIEHNALTSLFYYIYH